MESSPPLASGFQRMIRFSRQKDESASSRRTSVATSSAIMPSFHSGDGSNGVVSSVSGVRSEAWASRDQLAQQVNQAVSICRTNSGSSVGPPAPREQSFCALCLSPMAVFFDTAGESQAAFEDSYSDYDDADCAMDTDAAPTDTAMGDGLQFMLSVSTSPEPKQRFLRYEVDGGRQSPFVSSDEECDYDSCSGPSCASAAAGLVFPSREVGMVSGSLASAPAGSVSASAVGQLLTTSFGGHAGPGARQGRGWKRAPDSELFLGAATAHRSFGSQLPPPKRAAPRRDGDRDVAVLAHTDAPFKFGVPYRTGM